MIDGAQGSRLNTVIRPATTGETVAFVATLDTEITRVFVCNNTAGAVAFRLYHVPEGGVAGLDNALYYDKAVAANDTFTLGGDTNNGGIQLKTGESIVVRTATSNALGFHLYGVTASIAPGV